MLLSLRANRNSFRVRSRILESYNDQGIWSVAPVFQFTLTCSHRPISVCFVRITAFLVALEALICGLLFSKCSAKNLWLSSFNWTLTRQYGLVAKPSGKSASNSINTSAFTGTHRGPLRPVLGPWSPVPKCEDLGIFVEEHTSMALRPRRQSQNPPLQKSSAIPA